MPRGETGWVSIKIKIPSEWKEALEDIKRRQLYESLNDVVRSILREFLVKEHFLKQMERGELKKIVKEALKENQ